MNKSFFPGLLLICLAVPGTFLSAAPAKNCHLTQYATLDLSVLPNGSLLVPITIQDSPAFMILDTANAYSVITDRSVGRLGVKIDQKLLHSGVRIGATPIERFATVKGFSLGNVTFPKIDFLLIWNESIIGVVPGSERAIGTLGMNVFENVDVELDVANRKLNLFSQDHCQGHAVYWTSHYDSVPIRLGALGEFYFPMTLDGRKLETTLATANPMTTLSTDVTKKIYNFDSQSPDIETETDSEGRTTSHYRAMKMSGEGIDILNARVQLINPPANSSCNVSTNHGAVSYDGCLGPHPLKLGRNILTKLRIYIATKEKVLYFTPSTAPKASDQH
jgi:hypothetical protein